ncbi:hypothetical protein BD410DRAFT_797257 [Rickenella mellea]|uniref:RRM domain-containing protein n=1 Tax=Rickenella mellea TaxID=50990 RepID=A0A4Y7PGM0_9AGAM|nr:hypothetical protein BD410DRAFT_797257 [Rickenella mellea]
MQPGNRSASSSTRPGASPLPRATQVNTQTKVLDTASGRILCIADIRGRLSSLNDLAREANAIAIIHTGDFGFFDASSLERINDRTLRHLTMYSPLIPSAQRNSLLSADNPPSVIRSTMNISLLSEFPLLLSGQIKLNIPVYTVWGACEDVLLLEKFRMGTYEIENFHVIDEATTRCLDVGGVKLRILGLGGAFVPHKLFDNGDGNATIAGGQGTMWTTALQIGELVDTAQRVFDHSETRLLVTHASPGREGIVAQLALVLKADLTMSAGLHFRYASSYNEFSVQGDFEGFRNKLLVGKETFDKVWGSVKTQVDNVLDDNQRLLMDKALSVLERIPPSQAHTGPGGIATGEEPAWKNCWNWNLCDAAYGSLILEIKEGRISAELKSQGFNYAYRRSVTPSTAHTPNSTTSALPHQNHMSPSTSNASAKPGHLQANRSATSSGAPTPPPHAGQHQQSMSGSGKETPKEPQSAKVNGTSTPDKAEKDKHKKEKKKEKKEKERQEREAAKDANADGSADAPPDDQKTDIPTSGKATPAPPVDGADKPAVGDAEEASLMSPTAGTESTGARTPTSRKAPRNPWTLFVKMSTPANETELRDFFGEAKSGITRVNLPQAFAGRQHRIAYVEFGDEDAMKAGLEKHDEKLKDTVPLVVIAEDRETRDHAGGPRGRGRGYGRGGGYAARGFAAAGLTRQQQHHDRKGNGDAAKDTSEVKKDVGA